MKKWFNEIIVNWALSRLSEQSTWKGIVLAITSAGVKLKPSQAANIIAIGLAIVAAINIFRNEKKAQQVAADTAVSKALDPGQNGGTTVILRSPKDAGQ